MSVNISGFGTSVQLKASSTFPSGIELTQAADDADFLDVAEMAIADSGMGVNGTHVTWSKPCVVPITLNVVPTSVDDKNLMTLHDANRVGQGKKSARDDITIIITYPDGSTTTFSEGIIISGVPSLGVAQTGRFKTRPYKLQFSRLDRVNAS